MSMSILEKYNPMMFLINGRNQLVDAFFYDISSLTAKEWVSLTSTVDRKGEIIVVSPGKHKQPIRHYTHPLEFILKEREHVQAIAVAGVGSSDLGTAALARNVADVYDMTVAGIVSGYGLSDVMMEAIGGWCFYDKIDQLRYELEHSLADLNALTSQAFAHSEDTEVFKGFDFPFDDFVPTSLDVTALTEILLLRYVNPTRPKMNIRLLVGHSKGNLLISSALNHINNQLKNMMGDQKYHEIDLSMKNMAVVTFGAVVNLPSKLIKQENQYQFIGNLDLLGRINSRSLGGDMPPGVTHIDGAGHHLNSKIPGYLDVKAVLRKYLPDSKLPPPPPEDHPGEAARDLLFRGHDLSGFTSARSLTAQPPANKRDLSKPNANKPEDGGETKSK